MMTYKDKWTLITGASAGIGEEFAIALASQGCNLILVARRKERLEQLAARLHEKHAITCKMVVLDLAESKAAEALFAVIKQWQISIDILINNAGMGIFGRLHETDIAKNMHLINLNITTLTMLTQRALGDMVQKKSGIIINVASTAAFQALPYMAVYGASKAYVLSFTESLWAEYKTFGIKFLALCPGPVETEFFNVMGADIVKLGKKDTAKNVVNIALNALLNERTYVIPGLKNYWLANLNRFIPRKLATLITERILRK